MDRVLREWADFLFLANQAFFVVTFLVVAARALRERRRAHVDTALLFGVMATLMVIARVAQTAGVPGRGLSTMITPLILAVPYLMLRLIADFSAVPWWALRLAEATFAALIVAFALTGGLWFPGVAAYAAVPIAWASIAFVREARRARGVTRRRYAAIATGNAAVVASLVLAAVAVTLSEAPIFPFLAIALQLLVTLVGAAYFVGFAMPAWLRRTWRDTDLRAFLAGLPGLLAVRDADVLARELAVRAREVMGSHGVLIGLPAGPSRLRFRGTGDDYEASTGETFGGRAMLLGRALVSLDPAGDVPAQVQLYRERNVAMLVAAPIRVGGEVIGALTSRSSHVSLFAEDDIEMCQLLADQAAIVLKHRALIEERERQAEHDALTGLPHAHVLYRRIEERLAADETARPTALVLIDMDAFAEVNQTFGHPAGDELLAEIARRLSAVIPETGILGRWGGDQFGVLLPAGTVADAEALAQRMLTSLERPFAVGNDEIECGASIGIAAYPEHAADARGLVASADVALGIAKKAANTAAVYPLEIQPQRAHRAALRSDLRRAISEGAIHLEYQPLVSMRSGVLIRLEALARWDHPTRGRIPPSEFIDLAERTGLIRPLTDRVLRLALTDAKEWRRSMPRMRVAVNVSGRMFAGAALIDRIVAACTDTNCDLQGLALEITESILVTEPEHAQETIARLRELGVTTEIDDFGTGYSSLAYLQRLPVSGLKIDRQFIVAMSRDERSDAIVRAAIRLAHELGFEVAAEGIGDQRLWDLLAASGCDLGQGYFVARPMPADAVRGWMRSWLARAPAAPVPPALHPVPAGRARGFVVVVDDDPAILSVVRDVLSEHGYAVSTASDGEEAFAQVSRRRPDALLLDVHMPRVDGEALVARLRERGIDVPVVVTTSGPNAEMWAQRLGASAHLAKPFAVDDLLDATQRAIAGAAPAA